MTNKFYKVIDGPLSIRKTPNGKQTRKTLAHGKEITITGDPVEAGGYLWIQHDLGWSALSDDDESEIYMLDVSNRDPNEPRVFRIWSNSLSIRDVANGNRLSKKLYQKTDIKVEGDSRTEKGNYIWWKHDLGWSAERSIDGKEIFMREVFDKEAVFSIDPSKKVGIPAHWKGKFHLQAADDVKARGEPSTNPMTLIIRTVKRGKLLECDMDTLTEADNYYWTRHDLGWSAIQRLDGKTVFLAEPGTIPGLVAIGPNGPKAEDLPNYRALFTQLPVKMDDTEWLQYFGNIMFAIRNGRAYGYDRYSQGLHGGIDFGNNTVPVPIYAGLEAEYWKTEYPSKNNARIFLRRDDYIIIYQHITKAKNFTKGQLINPDTALAFTEHHSIQDGWDHLHLEVRFMQEWIVNPLLLFAPELTSKILSNFNPKKKNRDYKTDFPKSYLNFFYKTDTWTKWTEPYDQPMIKLGDPVIGPKAELDRADW
jgi:hypothetical protein